MGNSESGRWSEEEQAQDKNDSSSSSSSRRSLRRSFFKFSSTNKSTNDGDNKFFTTHEFSGIVRIQLLQAEMQFKDKWFACFSLGHQTFKTATSHHTKKPVWKSEKKVALEANGPRVARISVFETNTLRKNNLVGYCEVDLTDIFSA
ncbi:hypothetical protein KI387_024031, partial [Taxus chinensis]